MSIASTCKRFFTSILTPAPTVQRPSKVRLLVESLEARLVPATNVKIYITGGVTNGVIFTDPARFDDGSPSALTQLNSKTFLAENLRSAVAHADDFAGKTRIFLESNDVDSYKLTEGELPVHHNLDTAITIRNIAGKTHYSTIESDGSDRIFEVYGGGTTTFDHLVLTGGRVDQPAFTEARGGAILNRGTLNLRTTVVTDNAVIGAGGEGVPTERALGGGIYSAAESTLDIRNSTIDHNSAYGGSTPSLFNDGAGAEGGGLYFQSTTNITIIATTFDHNNAFGGSTNPSTGSESFGGDAKGGAIANDDNGGQNVRIVNSTFAYNAAYGGSSYGSGGNGLGGAIYFNDFGEGNSFSLVNDTIAFNGAYGGFGVQGSNGVAYGGGVFVDFAVLTALPVGASVIKSDVHIINTIIANNFPDDVFGNFDSRGHNLIGNSSNSVGFSTALKDILDQPAGLDPLGLQNNGGPTQTIAITLSSLALNAGDDAVVTSNVLGVGKLKKDQRGFPRKSGKHVDIGAYELQFGLGQGRDLLATLLGFTSGGGGETPSPPPPPPAPPK